MIKNLVRKCSFQLATVSQNDVPESNGLSKNEGENGAPLPGAKDVSGLGTNQVSGANEAQVDNSPDSRLIKITETSTGREFLFRGQIKVERADKLDDEFAPEIIINKIYRNPNPQTRTGYYSYFI